MKAFYWFSVVLIFTAIIFVGCSSNKDETNPLVTGDGGVMGFAAMTPGSWEELTTPDGTHERYEYIGVDTYNGTDCYVLEFDMTQQGEKMVTQTWMDKSSNKVVLVVMKIGDLVTKMEITQTPDIPSESGTVPVGSVDLGNKEYTTPTGKTVKAITYKTTTPAGESEVWISTEVPFGQVKMLLNGEVQSELYDFGTSGATRDISKQEAENAQSFGFPQG